MFRYCSLYNLFDAEPQLKPLWIAKYIMCKGTHAFFKQKLIFDWQHNSAQQCPCQKYERYLKQKKEMKYQTLKFILITTIQFK